MSKKKPYLTVEEIRELIGGSLESHHGKRCIILTDRLRNEIFVTVMEGLVSGGRGSETVAQRFRVIIAEED